MSAWRRRSADAAADYSAGADAAFRPWSEAALELRGVVVAPTQQEPVDLIVRRGEVTRHVAPSALELAEAAAGLRAPAQGEVLWFGEVVSGLRPAVLTRRRRGRIGWLPAESSLVPHLTVLENVLLPAMAARSVPDSLERADELLAELGLAEIARSRVRDMVADDGTRERVELARALLPAPSVLVAVDPGEQLEAALGIRAANGLAVLVTRTVAVEG